MRFALFVPLSCLGVVSVIGCSGGDSTTDALNNPSSGGGGAAGTGGAAATGGMGGTAGGASGGAGGADTFWSVDYSASGTPNPSTGEHNAGKNCMSCHSAGEAMWLFGGTVFQADGMTPASHVQVGVRDGSQLYIAYSGANGNFWVPALGATTIDWANAEVRLRNANGQKMMGGAAAAGCNSCHTGGMALTEP